MSLKNYLDAKPLYYTEIDYSRMPRVYEKIKSNFSDSIIVHLVGTNGKGTTGRFLATALFNKGYSTAHYTSPHILEFNERVWLNGEDVSYERLELAHEKLQTILSLEDSDSLSYFEYTTFLSMIVFEKCDYIILEAGLGGEYDATSVFGKTLTIVTPIDYDHESFLGTTIEQISTTKLNAIQKNAILANQKYSEVYDVAKSIEIKNGVKIDKVDALISKADIEKIEKISKNLSLATYLKENLKLAVCALNFLGVSYDEKMFFNSKLFGRLTKINENVLVDVGHNPLAASAIVKELAPQKFILIYNTYKDKDYKKILKILKPIIWHVEIIDVDEDRIELKDTLHRSLNHLSIKYKTYSCINKKEQYLVFGSFSVVQAFLKGMK